MPKLGLFPRSLPLIVLRGNPKKGERRFGVNSSLSAEKCGAVKSEESGKKLAVLSLAFHGFCGL